MVLHVLKGSKNEMRIKVNLGAYIITAIFFYIFNMIMGTHAFSAIITVT